MQLFPTLFERLEAQLRNAVDLAVGAVRDIEGVNGVHAASDHDRLLGHCLQRDHAGAKFLAAAQLALDRVAHDSDGPTNRPSADRLLEPLAGPERRVRAG